MLDAGNERHALGRDGENNLVSPSITKSEPANGHIYYVIVKIDPASEGLTNHMKSYNETNWREKYRSTFPDFGMEVMQDRISGSTQRHTAYHLIPPKDH